jgi:predicted nucleotidyltransferase
VPAPNRLKPKPQIGGRVAASRSSAVALARELGVHEQRCRAVACGTVHADRRGPARLELGDGEVAYLRLRWDLLSRLLQTLRTEPTVRLAVLCGSLARGEESADSGIDILIDAGDGSRANPGRLRARLQDVAGRDVDLVSMETAAGRASPDLRPVGRRPRARRPERRSGRCGARGRAALRQNAAADQRRAEANAREVFDYYARLAR